MVNRTEERVTFLGDILDEGMAAARGTRAVVARAR